MSEQLGTILSYRRGRHTQNVNQVLVSIEGVEDKEKAKGFIGKKLLWKTPSDKEMKGEITALHGNKGVLRAKFERNLPGQALKSRVQIV